MGFKDRFGFKQRHFVERIIGETTFRFYPNRVGLLPDLAEISRPLAKALSSLFVDRSRDTSVVEKVMTQDKTRVVESTVQAVSPETMSARAKERADAMDELVDAVRDERNRIILGRLLMDSLRDEFPYSPQRSAEDVLAFLEPDGRDYQGVDMPLLIELAKGWIAANQKVFGAAGEDVVAAARERLGDLNRSRSTIPTPAPGPDSRSASSPASEQASLSPT